MFLHEEQIDPFYYPRHHYSPLGIFPFAGFGSVGAAFSLYPPFSREYYDEF